MLISLLVVGATVSPYGARAPAAKEVRAIGGEACIFALIENYHFFTTQITTFGASAILNKAYICNLK